MRAARMAEERRKHKSAPAVGSPAPWMMKPLDEWAIVGMNHYHAGGEKRLFVAMTKGGRCIVEEGKDDHYLWNRLWQKATQPENAKLSDRA